MRKPRKRATARVRIPDFRTDAEAARFWERNDVSAFAGELEEAQGVVFARPRKEVVTLRLERSLLQRLRAVALKRGLPYSALIRMWVLERLRQAR